MALLSSLSWACILLFLATPLKLGLSTADQVDNCPSGLQDSQESRAEDKSVRDLAAAATALQQQLAAAKAAVKDLTESIATYEHLLTARGVAPAAIRTSVQPSHGHIESLQPSADIFHRVLVQVRRTWGDHLALQAAVRVDAEVTAAHLVPSTTRSCRFAVVGDAAGRLYFFLPTGALLAEHLTGGGRITGITSYQPSWNETVIITAHSDGTAMRHSVAMRIIYHREVGMPEEVSISGVGVLGVLGVLRSSGVAAEGGALEEAGLGGGIKLLQASRARHTNQFATVSAEDRITFWRGNGTRGSAAIRRPVLALAWRGNDVVLITPHASAAVSTSGSDGQLHVRTQECSDLTSSAIAAAAFDTEQPTRVHAISSDGKLLTIALGTGRGPNTVSLCKVLHCQDLAVGGLVAIAALQQYLLVNNRSHVAVYNSSLASRAAPRLVLLDSLQHMASQFGYEVADGALPLIAADLYRTVAVSIGGGVLGIYESQMPVAAPKSLHVMMGWTRPVFLLAAILMGGYHFTKARQRRMASERGRFGDMGPRLPHPAEYSGLHRLKGEGRFRQPGAPPFALVSSDDEEGDDSDGEHRDISGVIRAIERDLGKPSTWN